MDNISNIINEEQLKSEEGKWLTIAEAAKYLRISKDTLRRWEKEKILKPYRSPSNHRYYQKRELDMVFTKKPEFIEDNFSLISTARLEIANKPEKTTVQPRTIKVPSLNTKTVLAALAYLVVFCFLIWVFIVI